MLVNYVILFVPLALGSAMTVFGYNGYADYERQLTVTQGLTSSGGTSWRWELILGVSLIIISIVYAWMTLVPRWTLTIRRFRDAHVNCYLAVTYLGIGLFVKLASIYCLAIVQSRDLVLGMNVVTLIMFLAIVLTSVMPSRKNEPMHCKTVKVIAKHVYTNGTTVYVPVRK